MKHNLKVTLSLILLFVLAQFIGLLIISQYVDIKESSSSGETVINEDLYFVEPPKVENESWSWVYLMFPILFGTLIVLLLIKFKLKKIWKFWFALSIILALSIAFYPFMDMFFNYLSWSGALTVAVLFSAILTFLKMKYQGNFIHNFTEMFMYGGLAALFVPILNITSGIILLILIAIYDAYAVWHSKHMVAMANFQTDAGFFAGLSINYNKNKLNKINSNKSKTGKLEVKTIKSDKVSNNSKSKGKSSNSSVAILGGGDITFPLLFAGAVLKVTGNYGLSILISLGATIALALLLFFGKKGRFYPAMPFISSGCLIAFLSGFFLI